MKEQVNKLIEKKELARMIALGKIFPPFNGLLWWTLRTSLVSSTGKHEIVLAGIIESKIYNGVFNNIN